MAAPTTWPTAKQAVGWSKEVTPGTGVLPITASMPVEAFKARELPVWLDDKNMRQAMVEFYGRQQGVIHTEFEMSGSVFMDMLPFLVNNILGDITSSGAAPVSHACSLLNSGTAQPGTLTIVHWDGLPATTSSRYYPGACLSELTITGNAESTLLSYSAKGMSWVGQDVPTTPPSFSFSAVNPQAAWRYKVGMGGPAAGGTQVLVCRDFTITISRRLRPEFTLQNSQNPFIIQRGPITVTGGFTATVPADETIKNYMLNNTQPQLQILGDVGAGATNFGLTLDVLLGAFDAVSDKLDEEAIGLDATYAAIANTTNVGASGGYGPLKVTVRNQTAAGTY